MHGPMDEGVYWIKMAPELRFRLLIVVPNAASKSAARELKEQLSVGRPTFPQSRISTGISLFISLPNLTNVPGSELIQAVFRPFQEKVV